MANNYLGNFNLQDELDEQQPDMLAPPIQKNEDDDYLQKQLEEYNRLKSNPMEQQRIEDIRKQQADSEFYNTLGMLGEKLGRSIGRTTEPVDKEFYQQLSKSSAQQAAQQIGDIDKKREQRIVDFKTLNELRKQNEEIKKDKGYLKLQQDQEARAKERFDNEKQKTKLELEEAALSHQKELDKDDPNSSMSRTKVNSLSVQYPDMKDLFSGKSFNQLTILAEGIGGKLKRDDDMYNREQDREVKRQTQEMLNFNKQQLLDEKQRLNEAKQQERIDKQVVGYMKDLEKTNIPEATATIQEIDNLLSTITDDNIPGYGATALHPDFLISKKGTDIRQAVGKLFNIQLKDRSGAAVTPHEFERLRKEFGTGTFATDAQLIEGLRQYKNYMSHAIKNVNAGYRPEVRERYKTNISDSIDYDALAKDYSKKSSIEEFSPAQEAGIKRVMEKNKVDRQRAISELKKVGKL
jgi:hypothetical protein